MFVKSVAVVGLVLAVCSPAFAEGDAKKGEKVFKKCKACHSVGEGAKNKVGPVLTGIVGRQVGAFEGFKYGKSLAKLAETGLTWDEKELDDYLKNPKKYLRAKLEDKKAKSKMSFKLKKDGQRADVIAYLKTFSKPAE